MIAKRNFGARAMGFFSLIIFLAIFLAISPTSQGAAAPAQDEPVQEEPTETVLAPQPATFSQRSGLWPHEDLGESSIGKNSTSEDGYSKSYRLNSLPGLVARQEGSPTLSIRGSQSADRVMRLYQGIPLNLADGLGASRLFIPDEAIGSTRLIKGPASVFYGTSAMAGALDHSLRIFARPAARVGVADEGGKLGPRSLFVAAPFTTAGATAGAKKPNSQVTVYQETKPGEFSYTSVTNGSSARREHNSERLLRATAHSEHTLQAWRVNTDFLAAQAEGDNPSSLYDSYQGTYDDSATLAAVSAERAIGASGRDRLAVRLTDARFWGYFDQGTSAPSHSLSARQSVAIDSQNALSDGVAARTFADFSADQLDATYSGPRRYQQNNFDLGQSFDVALTANLSLEPSYRYRTDSGDWIKSLGLIQSSKPFTIWLTYAEGFRAPSLSDRFSDYQSFKGNPSLKAERSQALEVGAGFENGQHYVDAFEGVGARASLYSVRYFDFIETVFTGSALTKQNQGEALANGFEASVYGGGRVSEAAVTYNYLDAQNETQHRPLNLSPRHQLTAKVSRQFGPVIAEVRETVWSKFFERDSVGQQTELPEWYTTDLEFRTSALTDWEFRAGILNLFDRPRELTYGYPEPQRQVFASALRYF